MRFDALLFDIDNVLIDTRGSYTDCIRETVAAYLVTVLGFQPSRESLLSRADVETFKSFGGFNDDWDTCYGLLLYFLSLKPRRRSVRELAKQKNLAGFAKKIVSVQSPVVIPAKAGIQRMDSPVPPKRRRTDKPGNDRPERLQKIRARPLGLKGVERICGRAKGVTLGEISELFQRFYLGKFVWLEKPFIKRFLLEKFKRAGLKLGIVTGRNRDEAGFSLRRFKMDPFIDEMVTADETPKHLKKPNPYGLLKAASALGKNLRFLYVGDLPDDMIAAKRAAQKIKISACGCIQAAVNPSEMKRRLKASGAKYICKNPRELAELVQGTALP